MRKIPGPVLAALILTALPGCASRPPVQTFRVPPVIDLKEHELIGVIQVGTTSRGELGPLATRKLIEWIRRDQGMVRIVELGPGRKVLKSIGREQWDMEAFKILGREHGIRTIVTGELTVSDIRPDIRLLASMRSGSVSAQVDTSLAIQMIEASTGASIWSSSGGATASVGHISVMSGRNFAFDADDPERAYGALVETLVEQVTRDFRATWERR